MFFDECIKNYIGKLLVVGELSPQLLNASKLELKTKKSYEMELDWLAINVVVEVKDVDLY